MRKRRPKGTCKKTCSGCNNPLEETRIGKKRYCKKCDASYMKATRPKHKDLPPEKQQTIKERALAFYYAKKEANFSTA